MRSLFASDLHLSSAAPEATALFLQLLNVARSRVDSLYLLGDIFEIWLGDDDTSPPHGEVTAGLREFTDAGGDLYVMSGNRDFLLADQFSRATNATMLDDWYVVDLFGIRTLLTHGDLLCTRDVKYQAFRKYIRDPDLQSKFLAQSLEERRQFAANTRTGTKASMLEKDDDIMDVEQTTVEEKMAEFGVTRLIHGHTHRPADHEFTAAEGGMCERWVLGDWYESCSVVEVHENGARRCSARDYVTGADVPAS